MSEPAHRPERPSPESTVAGILFIALFAVVLIQVFGRTPLFTGPVWTEELARWIWVWMAFIAIAEVERTDGQLRMGFLADALKPRLRLWLLTVIDLVYLGLVCHLVLISWRTVVRTMRSDSVTLPLPDAALYAAVFVAMLLIVHRIARRVLARFRTVMPRLEDNR